MGETSFSPADCWFPCLSDAIDFPGDLSFKLMAEEFFTKTHALSLHEGSMPLVDVGWLDALNVFIAVEMGAHLDTHRMVTRASIIVWLCTHMRQKIVWWPYNMIWMMH